MANPLSLTSTSSQLIYNPQIQVLIATNNDGIIDVSSDIISFTLDRMTNAASTFTVTLNNRNRKYTINENSANPIIETMNRISVSMTRIAPMQVFAGYVTTAPILTILPNAIQITAKCTLKRLMDTYWDSSVPELRAILPGMWSNIQNQEGYADGGSGKGMFNLLADIVGWDPSQIYIEEIPEGFLNVASTTYSQIYPTLNNLLLQDLIAAVDGGGIVGAYSNGADFSSGTNNGPNNSGTNYEWAATVLADAQLPVTQNNVNNIVRWMANEKSPTTWWTEGSNWKLNPLNTTLGVDGSNSFPDLTTAATQTAKTILQPNMQSIYQALQQNADFNSFCQALVNSNWDGPNGKSYGGNVSGLAGTPLPAAVAYPNAVSAFDSIAARAIAAAQSQIGVPYVKGGYTPKSTEYISSASSGTTINAQRNYKVTNPGGFDCSGLVRWAYSQAGVDFGQSTTSQTQWSDPKLGPQYNSGTPIPGDLLFWYYSSDNQASPDHVTLCTNSPDAQGNNGTELQSSQPGQNIGYASFSTNDPAFVGFKRPWATATGLDSSGVSAQNASNSSGGSNVNNSTNTLSKPSAFNLEFTLPQFNPVAIMTYGSPRGFIMDEPVLNSISQLAGASFRNFMSLGTGEFIAWFPDYFGIYGTDAAYEIYNIEITDLSIYHSDDPLATHVAVAGDSTMSGLGQSVTPADWISTVGIVSVQTPEIMQMLFGPNSGITESFDAQAFLNKYGMRPYVTQQPLIRDHYLEFAYSVMTFMSMWAQQFSTDIGLTFMPEIFPGMRLRFPEIIIQGAPLEVYVQEVNHSGSMSNGFSTRIRVTAPSAGGKLIYTGLN